MNKVILLRFGEIFLKGKNKAYFENVLISNIKLSLKNFNLTFSRTSGRFLIENFEEECLDAIICKLTKIFGLTSLSVATKVEATVQKIEEFFETIVVSEKTFRVSVKRADKSFAINSSEFERILGGIILKNNSHLKVDLKNHQTEVLCDIRENGFAYIFTQKIACAGGMPLGTSSKGMLLLSGGIDSPVAAYMMAKRGMSVVGLHFHSFPYTSELAKQKVVTLAEKLTDYLGKVKLIVFPFTEIQENINKHCAPEFMIAVMRRIMMKVAAKLCRKYKCKAIITGENLGQVASQTVESMTSTNFSQTEIPIFRPLIAFDKSEIVEVAKKIDTYDTSILPYEDCCTVFLPKNPVIKPKLEKAIAEEAKLDVETLIENAMQKIEIIEC